MNTQRRVLRVGLAAFLSVLVVAAVVVTMHDDVSESVSALLQPTFTDLRIKLPPLPPLTEEQFKSLPAVSKMEYVPPTKKEVRDALARHGVHLHVFQNAKIPSMLAVDGHVTRAQAEAAERLKEMVLEDAKRADSLVDSIEQDANAATGPLKGAFGN